ncbi:MAG TPA: hypothetical protein PKA38_03800 [Candidatus Levybacteria bacterium]|nr:hypothetical protein [Candidatus Levybacteria bacterium]
MKEIVPPGMHVIKKDAFVVPHSPFDPSYTFGEVPHRSNFIPAVISTFGYSRGFTDAQVACFQFLEEYTGFHYKQSIENYLIAGGFNSLRIEEQAMVIKTVRGVRGARGHKSELTQAQPEEIGEGFDRYLIRAMEEQNPYLEAITKGERLKPRAFLDKLKEHVTQEEHEIYKDALMLE